MKRAPWIDLLRETLDQLEAWEATWPEDEAALPAPSDRDRQALRQLAEALGDNYPFFHPRYAGQMLKPPHPVAWAAQALTAAINPNNHALDGGPATARLEKEAVRELAAMVGYGSEPGTFLGHLTSSGTLANLEGLWVAREEAPGGRVLHSAAAHYTHGRMSALLGVPSSSVATDAAGAMDLEDLDQRLSAGDVAVVVATLGTTGLGAVDPLHEILPLAREAGARVHVDAAYGGYFTLLARRDPPLVDPAPWAALKGADSVAIDPHKHGLQPYGCGCVLFKDPGVGRHYAHDSAYTYFTSDQLHLGEISLECSRAGAAAAALWATMQAVPLEPHEGLGESLAAGRRAALAWAEAIEASPHLRLLQPPATDILAFAPWKEGAANTAEQVSAASQRVFDRAMELKGQGVYLALLTLSEAEARARWPELEGGGPVKVLRSVLMKPEHEGAWPVLHSVVEELVKMG